MTHLKRRSLCKSCRACFIRDNNTQVYCHGCLSDSLYPSRKLLKDGEDGHKKCLICRRWFFPINGRSTCGEQCKKELLLDNKNRYDKNKREKEAAKEGLTWEAKQWLNIKYPLALSRSLPRFLKIGLGR